MELVKEAIEYHEKYFEIRLSDMKRQWQNYLDHQTTPRSGVA